MSRSEKEKTKFGRTALEGGETIPRQSLSSRTQGNLNQLEDLGYDFGGTAIDFPVSGSTRHSFVISGIDPSGVPVTYVRRETRHKAAGQTRLYREGDPRSIRVSKLLRSRD